MADASPTRSPQASEHRPRLNLEQRRAADAWRVVEEIGAQHARGNGDAPGADEFAKNYARQAKKLSARIMASGLAQALSFVLAKSKGEDANGRLLRDLSTWLLVTRKRLPEGQRGSHPESAIIEAIVGRVPGVTPDGAFIRFATSEILDYLVWLNRFLEARGWTRDEDGADEN